MMLQAMLAVFDNVLIVGVALYVINIEFIL
jgi:hypothetical protein